jgi:hypothetical protein
LHASLDYMVLRMLSKDRAKRYTSAQGFLDDLGDFRNGRPLRSRASEPGGTDAEATLVAHKPPLTPPPRVPRIQAVTPQLESAAGPAGKKFPWLAIGAAAVLILILGGGLLRKSRQATPPPPAAEAPAAESEPESPVEQQPATGTSLEQPAQRSGGVASETPGPSVTEAHTPPAAEPPAPSRPEPAARGRSETAGPRGVPHLIRTLPGDRPWRWTPTPRDARFVWAHNLPEATMTLEAGGQILYRGTVRSDAGRMVRIARPMIVPANVRAIEVRVVTRAGSLELKDEVPAAVPPKAQATLVVLVSGRRLRAGWLPQRSREP